MKINFTKREYQTLVEMLLVADWIIRSHEEQPQPETQPYDALRKKVLSHYKETGMAGDFRYDAEDDEYFESAEYEARAPHARFLGEYDERMFWSLLADRLAARDLAADAAATGTVFSDQERFVRHFEIVAGYEQEFAENDLDNLRLVTEPASRLH
jgi:hypothetical protein